MGNISIGGRISLMQQVASLDLRYGPYASINDAFESMGPNGDEVITAGLLFGVTEDDGTVSLYAWTKTEDATIDDYKKIDKDQIVLFNGFIDISVSIKQQSYGNIATKDNIVFLSDRKQFAYRDGLNFYINWQNRYIWSNNNYIPYDDIIYIDIANNRSYYFNGTTLVGLGSDNVIKSINDKAPDSNGNINISKEDFELGNVDNTADVNKVVKGANEDGSGNNIATTYETKSDATTKQTALQEAIANLTGLNSTNFGGFSIQSTEANAISNIATLYTADGYTDELLWYMAGTSLSSVKAYRYNGSGTPTAISSDTYNCVDFSGLIADVNTLRQNQAALDSHINIIDEEIEAAVKTQESEEEELSITDEQGYVIAQFKNGHIVTKNFDSSKVVIDPHAFYDNGYTGERIDLSENLFKITNIGKLTESGAFQGGAAYGDYFVQTISGASMFYLYRISQESLTLVATIPFSAIDGHQYKNNNANFGIERYDSEDYFPLLYVSSAYDYCIHVFRLYQSNNAWTISQVQVISYPTLNNNNGYYSCNLMLDTNNGFLYLTPLAKLYTTINGNKQKFIKYNMPKLSDGNIEITFDDKLDYFETNYVFSGQGGFIIGNKVVQAFGQTGSALIKVLDLDRKKYISTIDLNAAGVTEEPEALACWRGQLIMTTYQKNVFIIKTF